jgi:hypothetical protein
LIRKKKQERSFKNIEASKSKIEKKKKFFRQLAKRFKLFIIKSRTISRRSLRSRQRIISFSIVDDAKNIVDLSFNIDTESFSFIDMQSRCRQNSFIDFFLIAEAKFEVSAKYRE